MNNEAITQYLLSFPEAVLDYPFGPDVAVYKIHDKMFALLGFSVWNDVPHTGKLNLKCNPLEAPALRDIFPAVLPGYHMNKKHWNSVMLDGSIPRSEVERMIDRSYALVVKGLKKSLRIGLEVRHGAQAIYRP